MRTLKRMGVAKSVMLFMLGVLLLCGCDKDKSNIYPAEHTVEQKSSDALTNQNEGPTSQPQGAKSPTKNEYHPSSTPEARYPLPPIPSPTENPPPMRGVNNEQ